MKNRTKNIFGTIEILGATLIWGYGFVAIQNTLDFIPLNTVMIWRYLIAFALFVIFFRKRLRRLSKKLCLKGLILGCLIFIGQYLQTKALACEGTTPGEVAFITTMYTVFVPFLHWILFHVKVARANILAVLLTIPGLFLLTGSGAGGLGEGEILAFADMLAFAVHILAADSFTKEEDVIALTTLQFGFGCLCAVIVSVLIPERSVQMMWSREVIAALAYLGILNTMIGFLLQFMGQKSLNPEKAAILLSTESVFGMAFSVAAGQEVLTMKNMGGCVLLIAAVLISIKN